MLGKFVDKSKWEIVEEPSPFRKGGRPAFAGKVKQTQRSYFILGENKCG